MPVDETVFRQLTEMGIGSVIARAAAERYSSVEPAINWVYSDDGMRWTPDTPLKKKRRPHLHSSGLDASYIETSASLSPPAPRLPPRPDYPANTRFASNNPFASSNIDISSPFYDPSTTASTGVSVAEDDDEDLRRALELSRGSMSVDDMTVDEQQDAQRQERERSIRAGGPPPPSPTGEKGDDEDVLGLVTGAAAFGPSDKTEVGNSMLVPSTQPPNQNTEDDDLNRALQESLMTASFHSAAAVQDEAEVSPKPRVKGAPLVYYSTSGKNTYAGLFLQALLAVPQIGETIQLALKGNNASGIALEGVDELLSAFLRNACESADDFIPVDKVVKKIRGTEDRFQYPPVTSTLEMHDTLLPMFNDIFSGLAASEAVRIDLLSHALSRPELNIPTLLDQPDTMFKSHLNPMSENPATHVRVCRTPSVSPDLYSSLSSVLWKPDAPTQSIVQLAEVLTVFLGWEYGAAKQPFRLDQRIVLDRFMQENSRHSALIRAQQSIQAGEARRLREAIDGLTIHNGQNLLDSLAVLIKHHETRPVSKDPIQSASRQEMKTKLQRTLDTLSSKTAALKQELEAKEAAASGKVFETEDPEFNKYVYDLRAVLMHDGMQVPGKHLYGYVRVGNQWWKIQEQEATEVEWGQVESDKTGIFMDGGVYCMIYSRNGPRPEPASVTNSERTPSPTEPVSENLIDLSTPTEDVPAAMQGSLVDKEMRVEETFMNEKSSDTEEVADIIMS